MKTEMTVTASQEGQQAFARKRRRMEHPLLRDKAIRTYLENRLCGIPLYEAYYRTHPEKRNTVSADSARRLGLREVNAVLEDGLFDDERLLTELADLYSDPEVENARAHGLPLMPVLIRLLVERREQPALSTRGPKRPRAAAVPKKRSRHRNRRGA